LVLLSKGFTKRPSKGGLANRFGAVRVALLDGYLTDRRINP